jgi:hypothetical protein
MCEITKRVIVQSVESVTDFSSCEAEDLVNVVMEHSKNMMMKVILHRALLLIKCMKEGGFRYIPGGNHFKFQSTDYKLEKFDSFRDVPIFGLSKKPKFDVGQAAHYLNYEYYASKGTACLIKSIQHNYETGKISYETVYIGSAEDGVITIVVDESELIE